MVKHLINSTSALARISTNSEPDEVNQFNVDLKKVIRHIVRSCREFDTEVFYSVILYLHIGWEYAQRGYKAHNCTNEEVKLFRDKLDYPEFDPEEQRRSEIIRNGVLRKAITDCRIDESTAAKIRKKYRSLYCLQFCILVLALYCIYFIAEV